MSGEACKNTQYTIVEGRYGKQASVKLGVSAATVSIAKVFFVGFLVAVPGLGELENKIYLVFEY